MKRSNWNVSYCSYKEIYSSGLISRYMTRTKIPNKTLVLKQWLKFLENEVLGSIFLAEKEVPVLPNFVLTVIPALSMPASAYTQCFIKHIPNHRNHGRTEREAVMISTSNYSVKINHEYFCWICLNWTVLKYRINIVYFYTVQIWLLVKAFGVTEQANTQEGS